MLSLAVTPCCGTLGVWGGGLQFSLLPVSDIRCSPTILQSCVQSLCKEICSSLWQVYSSEVVLRKQVINSGKHPGCPAGLCSRKGHTQQHSNGLKDLFPRKGSTTVPETVTIKGKINLTHNSLFCCLLTHYFFMEVESNHEHRLGSPRAKEKNRGG